MDHENYLIEEIRANFEYHPVSGRITWRVSPRLNVLKGAEAGCITNKRGENGYRVIGFRKGKILAHRLAWVLYHGEWPEKFIDHANGVKSDNRILNLREATFSQNEHNRGAQRNSAHGLKGVVWDASKNRWRARIMFDNRRIHVGHFRSKEAAAEAYKKRSVELVGEFSFA